ncbi:LuxR C-terminal-related transcriptional regulator [Ralstonia sp. 22086]|jgi:DNA-binding NarL/FixJ family response regulator|uniref:Transcriptional regulatory protein DegU n=1 Tax=Ralstonia wenshanensis TaxID=2842456 RepID=A0AAD2ETH6_9RALS|nr:response regulator transcription factor [Ralstonia wenshanensis]MDY7507774.1 response regulator transcription factor [Ralstonia wenshanensis]UGS89586.1 response regulator transcription factor [Ralstonia wenshanensis]CAJ0705088.1 Transcriptional regulatory protein DegU [Ralstonia wenshanensis]CAJ0816509.1 Transcriptional regulatory protein DegU [Ralstonia wenshanensis]
MNILVIDSLPLFAAGVSNVLNALDAQGVFIDTHYAEQIGPACRQAEPSAVVMEWSAQDDDARQRLSELKAVLPEVPVLLTVQAVGRHVVGDALRFGAAGVVDRQATADVLLEALQRITSGAVYLPPISNLSPDDPRQSLGESPVELWRRLTPRQHEVLQLLAEGKSNKQICRVLNVAEGTIKNHLYALFRQIGVNNRTEAALWLSRCKASLVRVQMCAM